MNMTILVMAKLLKNSRSLLFTGYLIFISSLCTYLIHSTVAANILNFSLISTSLFCLLLHQYIAVRVQFDGDLLQTFIDHPQLTSKELDQSLLQLKLMPIEKTQRSWEQRTQGCLKLFKLQFFILFLQFLILLSMLFITSFWGLWRL